MAQRQLFILCGMGREEQLQALEADVTTMSKVPTGAGVYWLEMVKYAPMPRKVGKEYVAAGSSV